MVEVIKHLFGVCGEGHINIWHIAATGGATFAAGYYYLKHTAKWCWKKGCDICKGAITKVKKDVREDI